MATYLEVINPGKGAIFHLESMSQHPTNQIHLALAKYIIDECHCPVCHGDAETIEHALLECSFAREVWALANFRETLPETESLKERWTTFVERATHEDQSRSAILMWGIWNHRNELLWRGR